MEMPNHETDRLRLRAYTIADLDWLAANYGDPEVMRNNGPGLPGTREVTREKLAAMIFRWESRRIPLWAVQVRQTGDMIGRCGFSPYLDTDEIELSYTFEKRSWGLGFATEAARVCLGHARERCPWPRIIARAHPDNSASRHVIEKLGFRFDRVEMQHRDGPAVLYTLDTRAHSAK
jgi:RimJ/RimL family protein N-acetyltransferase